MSYYNKLNISKFLGHEVFIALHNNEYFVGKVTDGLLNECWEEDEEDEMLAIKIGNSKDLEAICLKEIRVITRVADAGLALEAV